MGSVLSDTSVFCHISPISTGTATSAAACWSRSAREGGYLISRAGSWPKGECVALAAWPVHSSVRGEGGRE